MCKVKAGGWHSTQIKRPQVWQKNLIKKRNLGNIKRGTLQTTRPPKVQNPYTRCHHFDVGPISSPKVPHFYWDTLWSIVVSLGCLPSSSFIFCNEPLWLAHHKKKVLKPRRLQIENYSKRVVPMVQFLYQSQ
jgi:hypothetical protein